MVNAKIINYGEWSDYTHIEFHLLCPQMKLEYTPKPGEKMQEVYLKKVTGPDDEVSYEIAVKEAVKE